MHMVQQLQLVIWKWVEVAVMEAWWVIWSLHGWRVWWLRHSLVGVGSTRTAGRTRRTFSVCTVALVFAPTASILTVLTLSSRYFFYYSQPLPQLILLLSLTKFAHQAHHTATVHTPSIHHQPLAHSYLVFLKKFVSTLLNFHHFWTKVSFFHWLLACLSSPFHFLSLSPSILGVFGILICFHLFFGFSGYSESFRNFYCRILYATVIQVQLCTMASIFVIYLYNFLNFHSHVLGILLTFFFIWVWFFFGSFFAQLRNSFSEELIA